MRLSIFSGLVIFILTLMCGFTAWGAPQRTGNGDFASFELNAVAPPVPSLKYSLLFDVMDRTPGNAALNYLSAVEFDKFDEKTAAQEEKAENEKDPAAFDRIVAPLVDRHVLFEFLEIAGRCDGCEWDSEYAHRGYDALLPYLNDMRVDCQLISLKAAMQMHQGHPVEAIETLRLGYEMSRKLSGDRYVVSVLVATGIRQLMNDRLIDLMNRPDSPNLYWALVTLPPLKPALRDAVEGERMEMFETAPNLKRARSQELSLKEWKEVFSALARIQLWNKSGTPAATTEAADSLLDHAENLREFSEAKQKYKVAGAVSSDDPATLEPGIILARFYFNQYLELQDETFRCVEMPYQVMIPRLKAMEKKLDEAKNNCPHNVFLPLFPLVSRTAETLARADRKQAAMIAVEALRSYAAANKGELPSALSEIKETPVLENPYTGRPFTYEPEGEMATLSDSSTSGNFPLEYTVKLRN